MQRLSTLDSERVNFGLLEKRDASPRNVVRLKGDAADLCTPLLQTGRAVIDKALDGSSTELTILLDEQQAEVLRKLEGKSLEYVSGMQVDWFDKIDEDVLRDRFVSGLHGRKLKLKLPSDTVVFDTKRDHVGPEHYSEVATHGRNVVVVFEVPYIGFARTKFGLVYRARQVVLLDEKMQIQPGPTPPDDGIDADDALFSA